MLLRGTSMRKILVTSLAWLMLIGQAFADSQGSATGGTAGTQSTLAGCLQQSGSPTSGQQLGLSCDINGDLKVTGGGSGGSVLSKPAPLTIIPLDISTVTTGGTAVTALTAGHRTAGGFLTNPKAATIDLCVNEQGVASGTTTFGALICVPPGGSYNLVPAAGAVSVITSDSSHPFGGEGMN